MFIVLGGLILAFAIPAFSHRNEVLVVVRPVAVGSTITDDDIATATITSDPRLKPIDANERETVIGKIATVDLVAGTLVTRKQLGTSDGFLPGQVLIAVPLKAGQYPARGLAAGQHVLIVATPTTGSGLSAGSVDSGSITRTEATVSEVGTSDPASGVTVVDVRVAADIGPEVARLASSGGVVLILLPSGG